MPKSILTFITHRIIQFCRLSLNLMSVFWFDFDGTKTKKLANDQAKLLIGQGKPKKTFCRRQQRTSKKLVDNSVTRNTKKSRNYAGTIYVRSHWEIIIQNFTVAPEAWLLEQMFIFLSVLGIILCYTSRWKGLII